MRPWARSRRARTARWRGPFSDRVRPCSSSGVIPEPVRRAYLEACRAAVPSIVADYRASAGVDLEHDLADQVAVRGLSMPVSVLQQA